MKNRIVNKPLRVNNGCTALVIAETAIEKIIPKPSKRDVIKAAAKALYDERYAEWDRLSNNAKRLVKQAEEAARAMVTVSAGCTVVSVDRREWGCAGYEVKVIVPLDHKAIVGMDQTARQALKEVPAAPSYDLLLRAIQGQAQQRAAGVDQLLADPEMRTKLASMAKELLRRPTAEDKASAVTV